MNTHTQTPTNSRKPRKRAIKRSESYVRLRLFFKRWLADPTHRDHLDNLVSAMVDHEIKHHLQLMSIASPQTESASEPN
jgi:hypothetical protein